MKLSHYSQGRDNNFNLIRVVAASAVLVTHSFALTWKHEPFLRTLGMTMGTWALDAFFLISGFLVTSSLLSRQSTIEFIWARILRIYPALVVMVLLTVFLLGPSFTTLSLSSYFSSPETHIYLAQCASLVAGVADFLPGVFQSARYPYPVNGSLWSLPVELYLYATWALLWLFLLIASSDRAAIFKAIVVGWAVIAFGLLIADHFFFHAVDRTTRVIPLFLVGAAFYVLRDYIILSRWLFYPLLAGVLLATSNKDLFFVVYIFSIAYILLYLAYVPSGFVRRYNNLGDYSYGIYLYAYPVQQSVAAIVPGISVEKMIILSGAITLLLAFLSWHLLERWAIGLKEFRAESTRKLLAIPNKPARRP